MPIQAARRRASFSNFEAKVNNCGRPKRIFVSKIMMIDRPSQIERIRQHVEDLKEGSTYSPYFLRNQKHPLVTELVLPLLDHPDLVIRRRAIESLGFRPNPDAVDALLAKLNLPDEIEGAILALGRIGDARAVEPLLKNLADERTRSPNTIVALGLLADERAINPLLATQSGDILDEKVMQAFSHLPAPPAIPKLRHTLLRFYEPEHRQKLFLLSHHYAVLALEKAAWQPEENLAGFMYFLYQDMAQLYRCGTSSIDYLMTILDDIPAYKWDDVFTAIYKLYNHADETREIKTKLDAYADRIVSHRRCPDQPVDIPLSYYFQSPQQRPNLCGAEIDYVEGTPAFPIPPHVPVILHQPSDSTQPHFTFAAETSQGARFVRQSGADIFAQLTLKIVPNSAAAGIRFISQVEETKLDPLFTHAIVEGLYQICFEKGVVDHLITGFTAILVDALEHPVDSRPLGYKIATKMALEAAYEAVGVIAIADDTL
ncbi:MAG: HEAT repeat domain-containing protein, partial [Chloroflexota bacterium]